MGLIFSKRPTDSHALVAGGPLTTGGPLASPPSSPRGSVLNLTSTNVNLDTSLNESTLLFLQDESWLDEAEMITQEDEDAKMLREFPFDTSPREWLESRGEEIESFANSIEIVDSNTQKKFLGVRKTVEYSIKTETATVKRRYRDFVALRDGLDTRFPGVVVPPLPVTKNFNKTDPGFVSKRKLQLELFLRAVARHPYLSADGLFIEFVASSSKFDRRGAWKSREALLKSPHNFSLGSRRWGEALLTCENPENAAAILETATSDLTAIYKHLNQLKAAIKANSSRAALYSTTMTDMAASFMHCQAEEDNLGVLIERQQQQPSSPSVSSVLSRMQQTYARNAQVVGEVPASSEESVVTAIRYEMLFVEKYLEMIRATKHAMIYHKQKVASYRHARENSVDVITGGSNKSASQTQVGVPPDPDLQGGNGVYSPPPPSAPPPAGEGGGGALVPHDGETPVAAAVPQSAADAERARARLQKMRIGAMQAQMVARRYINGVLVLDLARFRVERTRRISLAIDALVRLQRDQAMRIEQLWSNPFLLSTPHAAAGEVAPNGTAAFALDLSIPTVQTLPSAQSTISRRSSHLRALYEFKGENPDELDVQPGEVFEGTVDEMNPEWIVAQNVATGKSGLVPANYLELVDESLNTDPTTPRPPPPPLPVHARTRGEDNDDEYDSEDDESDRPPVTNYIKQTQASFGTKQMPASFGTKRTNAER